VEWRGCELCPRFVAFCDKRGWCEKWIEKAKDAIQRTRLSGRSFAANAVGFQLDELAYNLCDFPHKLATPEPTRRRSLTNLKEKRIKNGAKVVSNGRCVAFQIANFDCARRVGALLGNCWINSR
jgi:hypothetical protein